ncbi:MAG: Nif3-like dinuclear metal center hexameric protein [Eggerthellaceae bacterium]|nr:Nif3-like dinuclear metal center hexameric protein [Eggerthellaceae bacterium]
MKIFEFEKKLLQIFPRKTAESWDQMGLVVGDGARDITHIMCALDVTYDTIDACVKFGANVLLTHHPIFLEPPECIANKINNHTGSLIVYALKKGVALINIHTALDVSPHAFELLPNLLGLTPREILLPLNDFNLGYGQISFLNKKLTLHDFALLVKESFSSTPRIWGDKASYIKTVATWTGSVNSEALEACRSKDIDVLVCGEIKYHGALDAVMQGLKIVELGHDISEFPLVSILAQQARKLVGDDKVLEYEQPLHWFTI